MHRLSLIWKRRMDDLPLPFSSRDSWAKGPSGWSVKSMPETEKSRNRLDEIRYHLLIARAAGETSSERKSDRLANTERRDVSIFLGEIYCFPDVFSFENRGGDTGILDVAILSESGNIGYRAKECRAATAWSSKD
jgi:hypothetical protein